MATYFCMKRLNYGYEFVCDSSFILSTNLLVKPAGSCSSKIKLTEIYPLEASEKFFTKLKSK